MPRGHQRTVNQSIGKLRELRTALREATISADEWAHREQASRDATEAVVRRSQQRQDLVRERSRIDRLKRVLPMLAERKELQERIVALKDAVLLAEDFPKQRQEAEAALRAARQNLERASKDLHEQVVLVERLGQTPALVAESEAIDQLHVDLGTYRKALSDRPRLIGQRYEQRSLAKRLLAEWRPELEIEESAALRVFVGRRARLFRSSRPSANAWMSGWRPLSGMARRQQSTRRPSSARCPSSQRPETTSDSSSQSTKHAVVGTPRTNGTRPRRW